MRGVICLGDSLGVLRLNPIRAYTRDVRYPRRVQNRQMLLVLYMC